jgi:hypothetical protein
VRDGSVEIEGLPPDIEVMRTPRRPLTGVARIDEE